MLCQFSTALRVSILQKMPLSFDFENKNFSWLNQKAIDGGLASHVKIRLCHLQQTLGMLPLFTPTCFKHCEGIRILAEGSDSCLLQELSLNIQDDILYRQCVKVYMHFLTGTFRQTSGTQDAELVHHSTVTICFDIHTHNTDLTIR